MWPEVLLIVFVLATTVAAVVVMSRAADWRRRAVLRGTWGAWLLWLVARVYVRLMHRPRYDGLELVPSDPARPGPLIFIANHTAGVDPVLIQAALPYEIRWIMMREMNIGPIQHLTRYLGTILVDRGGGDFSSVREALRHVRGGGALGVFPEGGIERPPGTIRPFQEGAGFIIARSGAPVIPVWISGTPTGKSSLTSLHKRSRSRVVFGAPMDFSRERDAAAITARLRERIAEMSGWVYNDEPESRPDADGDTISGDDRETRR